MKASRDCASCEFRTLRMFCNLSDAALADFETLGAQRTVPSGRAIFRENERSGDVIVICTGQVKLSCTSREGKTLILKIAMPGDVLGLGAVISGTNYEVTAETLETTQVKVIPRADFLPFLDRHSQVGVHAARSLSEDYKSAFFDARRLALSTSAAARLASLLLSWGKAASCGRPALEFTMALTHEDLANMVGTSRETVSRVLSRFRQQGLIATSGSSVLLLSPERLEEMAV